MANVTVLLDGRVKYVTEVKLLNYSPDLNKIKRTAYLLGGMSCVAKLKNFTFFLENEAFTIKY